MWHTNPRSQNGHHAELVEFAEGERELGPVRLQQGGRKELELLERTADVHLFEHSQVTVSRLNDLLYR